MQDVNIIPESNDIDGSGAAQRDLGTQFESGSDEVKLLIQRFFQLEKELRDRDNEVYRLREEISTLWRNAFGFSSLKKS